jgi:general secretion pathway protein G
MDHAPSTADQHPRRPRNRPALPLGLSAAFSGLGVLLAFAYSANPRIVVCSWPAAQTQIYILGAALDRFRTDHGRYPTEKEGLRMLHPYLTKDIPLDPWNRPYVYRYPSGPEPEIMSFGADGQQGGEGANADFLGGPATLLDS